MVMPLRYMSQLGDIVFVQNALQLSQLTLIVMVTGAQCWRSGADPLETLYVELLLRLILECFQRCMIRMARAGNRCAEPRPRLSARR